jgi:hypothetical protein
MEKVPAHKFLLGFVHARLLWEEDPSDRWSVYSNLLCPREGLTMLKVWQSVVVPQETVYLLREPGGSLQLWPAWTKAVLLSPGDVAEAKGTAVSRYALCWRLAYAFMVSRYLVDRVKSKEASPISLQGDPQLLTEAEANVERLQEKTASGVVVESMLREAAKLLGFATTLRRWPIVRLMTVTVSTFTADSAFAEAEGPELSAVLAYERLTQQLLERFLKAEQPRGHVTAEMARDFVASVEAAAARSEVLRKPPISIMASSVPLVPSMNKEQSNRLFALEGVDVQGRLEHPPPLNPNKARSEVDALLEEEDEATAPREEGSALALRKAKQKYEKLSKFLKDAQDLAVSKRRGLLNKKAPSLSEVVRIPEADLQEGALELASFLVFLRTDQPAAFLGNPELEEYASDLNLESLLFPVLTSSSEDAKTVLTFLRTLVATLELSLHVTDALRAAHLRLVGTPEEQAKRGRQGPPYLLQALLETKLGTGEVVERSRAMEDLHKMALKDLTAMEREQKQGDPSKYLKKGADGSLQLVGFSAAAVMGSHTEDGLLDNLLRKRPLDAVYLMQEQESIVTRDALKVVRRDLRRRHREGLAAMRATFRAEQEELVASFPPSSSSIEAANGENLVALESMKARQEKEIEEVEAEFKKTLEEALAAKKKQRAQEIAVKIPEHTKALQEREAKYGQRDLLRLYAKRTNKRALWPLLAECTRFTRLALSSQPGKPSQTPVTVLRTWLGQHYNELQLAGLVDYLPYVNQRVDKERKDGGREAGLAKRRAKDEAVAARMVLEEEEAANLADTYSWKRELQRQQLISHLQEEGRRFQFTAEKEEDDVEDEEEDTLLLTAAGGEEKKAPTNHYLERETGESSGGDEVERLEYAMSLHLRKNILAADNRRRHEEVAKETATAIYAQQHPEEKDLESKEAIAGRNVIYRQHLSPTYVAAPDASEEERELDGQIRKMRLAANSEQHHKGVALTVAANLYALLNPKVADFETPEAAQGRAELYETRRRLVEAGDGGLEALRLQKMRERAGPELIQLRVEEAALAERALRMDPEASLEKQEAKMQELLEKTEEQMETIYRLFDETMMASDDEEEEEEGVEEEEEEEEEPKEETYSSSEEEEEEQEEEEEEEEPESSSTEEDEGAAPQGEQFQGVIVTERAQAPMLATAAAPAVQVASAMVVREAQSKKSAEEIQREIRMAAAKLFS